MIGKQLDELPKLAMLRNGQEAIDSKIEFNILLITASFPPCGSHSCYSAPCFPETRSSPF